MVVESTSGAPASIDDAAQWKESLELTIDVVADSEQTWVESWGDEGGGIFNQHSYTAIDSDGRVTWHTKGQDGTTLDRLIEAVQAAD